jgi:hypothetical protein
MAKKIGRPKKELDQKSFEAMCAYQCTIEEICAFMGVSDKTLTRWCKETYGRPFSEIFRQKREIGKVSLRRKQWHLADKSASMAIFLGKNYLGQTDRQEVTFQSDDDESLREMEQYFNGRKKEENT